MKVVFVGFYLLINFIHFTATAQHLTCFDMKVGFSKTLQLHIFNQNQNYLSDLLGDPENWRVAYQNLVSEYDPHKIFFFKSESELSENEHEVPSRFADDFEADTLGCPYSKEFYQKFEKVFQRHVNLVTTAYGDEQEFYTQVIGFAKIKNEDLPEGDKKLLDDFPENAEQLIHKVKLVTSRKFQDYMKQENDEKLAFAITMKDLRLIRKSYSLRNPNLVYSVALSSALNALDAHTIYLWEELSLDFMNKIKGGSAELGVVVGFTLNGLKVIEILPDGPIGQQQVDLQVNDVITSIDGESLKMLSFKEATKKLHGPIGSHAKLDVIREGTSLRFKVQRGIVSLSDDLHKREIINMNGSRLGYFNLTTFYGSITKSKKILKNGASQDFIEALNYFNKQSVDGLLIDLRFNYGGVLNEAISMLTHLLAKGPLLQMGTHLEQVVLSDEDNGSVTFSKPIVVLVNAASASASEIFAGVLQSYRRALIVGPSKTYGKGAMQTVLRIGPGFKIDPYGKSLLKVTTQFFYLPNGDNIHFEGIKPDYLIHANDKSLLEKIRAEKEENPLLMSTGGAPNLLEFYSLWPAPRLDQEITMEELQVIKRTVEGDPAAMKDREFFSDFEVQQALTYLVKSIQNEKGR